MDTVIFKYDFLIFIDILLGPIFDHMIHDRILCA